MPLQLTSHIFATLLSLQFLIGGQARLPFSPTPQIQNLAMANADSTLAAFPFVPLDAITFMRVIGVMMCVASAAVVWPVTRRVGCVLAGCMSLWFVSSGWKPWWLPVVNLGLALAIWMID